MLNKLRLSIFATIILFCMQGVVNAANALQSQQDTLLSSSVDIGMLQEGQELISLVELLEKVEQNYDATFLFKHRLVADKFVERGRVGMSEQKVKELFVVIEELGLRYEKIDDETYVILPQKASLQEIIVQHEVSGVVTDAASGEPLPGVNVVVKGTTIGTATDTEGRYNLEVPGLQDTLVFSFIGFQAQTVPINGRTEINITLQTKAFTGQELVVVGYGKQEQGSLTSSVSVIESQQIEKKTIFINEQALQGTTPGVIVTDRGGAPGSAAFNITVRGYNSLGENAMAESAPLVLVNGIEQNFNDINPNAIESITVLKDASATAIYGSRGANGVILVTTKNPEAGDLQISYNGYYGIQEINYMPNHLDLEPYMHLQNAAYVNRGSDPLFTETEIQEYVNADNRLKYPLPNTMWQAVFSPAPIQSHSLQVGGGTETLNSLLTLNYFNQDGIIPNFYSDRFEGRLNTNFTPKDWVRVNAKLTYRRKETHKPYEIGAIYWRLFHSTQWTVPQYPDGTYGVSNQGHNPLMYAEVSGDRNYLVDYLVANLTADFDILDNLTYTFKFGGFIKTTTTQRFKNAYQIYDYFDKSVILKDVSPNELQNTRGRGSRWTWRNLLNYRLDLGAHQFDILAGYEEVRDNNSWLEVYRQNFYNNNIRAIKSGSEENWGNDGNITDERLRSVFGRLNYAFDNTYIFEVSARYDGSSKFYGSNNQYSFFPAFSAAWRISNESFWDPFKGVVNSLKLRASWGKSGNNAVDLYTFFPGLTRGSYSFGGRLVGTYLQEQLSNQGLTWETTTQANIGLDAAFLEGKFELTFNYYQKRTEGILLVLPIPGVMGLDASVQNAGIVENKGWELGITHRNTLSEDLSYSISANLSDVRNEIIDLAGTGPYTFGEGDLFVQKEGASLNSLYGFKALGFFQSEEEVQNYPSLAGKDNTFPGDLKYADLNGDGNINGDDRTIIGSTIPHYTFGINGQVNYKNFDLSFFLQGVGDAEAEVVGAAREGGNWEGFTPEIAGDYWTPDNRDARFPRPQKRSRKNTSYNSSWWVIDASYIRLKNINLGYTLPMEVSDQLGINSLRLYVSVRNLFTISEATKWGIDPEFPSGRINYYPQVKSYTVGVNIEF